MQPHGVIVVADSDTLVITHVSENTESVLGIDPLSLLGQQIGIILDAETIAAVRAVLDRDQDATNPTLTTVGGQQFDVIVHMVDGSTIVEFEPYRETSLEMILATRQVLRHFAGVTSVAELWELAALEFRKITGFDRVLVEHFDSHGHGEIVADAVAADLEPRVGLRLPSSGIPDHARALAGTKLSRLIVNTGSPAVALLADPRCAPPELIDLSRTELRAVSPHHLAFMRDQGMTSSFTLSLVRNGVLVGMIIGGHRTERRLPFYIRDGFEILANQVALQATSMRDLENLARRDESRKLREGLVAQLARSDDFVDALLHQHVTLLDLIPADGAAIRLGDRVDWLGVVPPASTLLGLPERLAAAAAPDDVVTERLGRGYPELGAELPGVAGLLVQPLSRDGDYLAWFRGERGRFPGWTDEFSGTSEPWEGIEREAPELARDLQAALLRRAESRLAELALQDPLTGLPNRRLLMERLEQELVRLRRGERLAVLFIDLDRFKAINDTFGHAAGDSALRHTAAALRDAARAEDTVARLGGDEFVILCPGVGPANARSLAARLLGAITASSPHDAPWTVSASIGLTLADGSTTASQVLSTADAALYRAKLAGIGTIAE